MSVSASKYHCTKLDHMFLQKEYSMAGLKFTEKEFEKMSSVKFALFTASPLLKSAAVGTGVGAFTGGIIGGCTLGPPGILPGIAKGALIGFCIGIAGGCIYMFFQKNPYREWRVQHSGDKIIEEFDLMHTNSNVLADFVCHITNLPIVIPVRDKYGNVYDRDGYIQWIKTEIEAKGSAQDPKRNGPITLDDLTIDYRFMSQMQAQYKNVLKWQSEIQDIHPDVKEGLEIASKSFEEKVKNFYENQCIELLKDLREKKITAREYANKIQNLAIDLDIE